MCKKMNKNFHSDTQTYTETDNDINTYKKYGPYVLTKLVSLSRAELIAAKILSNLSFGNVFLDK